MKDIQTDIDLIIRGNKFGVQLDVKKFPILCVSCNQYIDELFEHKESRYGQVGTVVCKCGKTLNLVDSDNIVEFIKIHFEGKVITLDFKKIFELTPKSFEKPMPNK